MLVINRIITYKTRQPEPKPKLTRAERVKARRAVRQANGLCMQCGGERPCKKCSDRAVKWKRDKKSKAVFLEKA